MIRRHPQQLRSQPAQNTPATRALHLLAAGMIAASVSTVAASGIDQMAHYCLGSTSENSGASHEECFPLRPIPDDDNTYDALVESQTATEDLGQVCLEFMQGPPSSTAMLEVTFKTSHDWVITDAHFWLGSRIEDAPKMIMHLHDDNHSDSNADETETDADPPSTARNHGSEDEHDATTTYGMPDASHFPYYTTMEDVEDPRLRTTTEWNEVIEATPDIMCPVVDEYETQEFRFFSAQAMLRAKLTDDGNPTGLRPIVAFAAMHQETSFRSMESFFLACACPGSLVQEGVDMETETAEEAEEEIEQDEVKSNNLLSAMFAEDKDEDKEFQEQQEQQNKNVDETEEAMVEEESKEDEISENSMLGQIQKEEQEEEQFEELQEWKQDHGNPGDETEAQEVEDESKEDEVTENNMLEQMNDEEQLEELAEEMEQEKVGDKNEDFEDTTNQEKPNESNLLEEEKIDEQLDEIAEKMEEDRKAGKDHAGEDYVEVQEGHVDSHGSEEEAEAVIVNADELELTTSFIVVVPDQKHYMDVLLDESYMHATEAKIEASPDLHEAWHTFVGQLMGDFNVPRINSTEIRGSVKSEKDIRRTAGEDDPLRHRNLKTVTIEWIEDSPDLFKFLITTPCPASVLHMLGNKQKRGKRVIDMGSSPKALIRAGNGQDSTFDEATCYKAFGKYKVMHLKDPIDEEERVSQDTDDVGASRQEACYDIFHMTRLALAKDKLGQDLPESVPFLIHGGKPESCLPTGFATTLVKPAGLLGIDLTHSNNATDGIQHRTKDPLYELHNEDGSWNILRVMELVAYVSTSMLMMSLCIVIYCYFLPKIDMECRNQVTDDWSQPSMRPTRIRGSRRGKPKPKNTDYFPWLE